MLPSETQNIIMDYKTRKEKKEQRVTKMQTDLVELKTKIEKSINEAETHQDTYTMKQLKKLEGMVYALKTLQAWIILENAYEFDPKDELGTTEYVLVVDKLRNVKVK